MSNPPPSARSAEPDHDLPDVRGARPVSGAPTATLAPARVRAAPARHPGHRADTPDAELEAEVLSAMSALYTAGLQLTATRSLLDDRDTRAHLDRKVHELDGMIVALRRWSADVFPLTPRET
jgi:hypothetical protein